MLQVFFNCPNFWFLIKNSIVNSAKIFFKEHIKFRLHFNDHTEETLYFFCHWLPGCICPNTSFFFFSQRYRRSNVIICRCCLADRISLSAQTPTHIPLPLLSLEWDIIPRVQQQGKKVTGGRFQILRGSNIRDLSPTASLVASSDKWWV